jgi:hypothetical protein
MQEEEKGRVIFFPVIHFPSYTELSNIEKLNDWYNWAIQQIELECGNDRYALALRKQMLANRIRAKFYVVNDT